MAWRIAANTFTHHSLVAASHANNGSINFSGLVAFDQEAWPIRLCRFFEIHLYVEIVGFSVLFNRIIQIQNYSVG
jgi:hypothetical protein